MKDPLPAQLSSRLTLLIGFVDSCFRWEDGTSPWRMDLASGISQLILTGARQHSGLSCARRCHRRGKRPALAERTGCRLRPRRDAVPGVVRLLDRAVCRGPAPYRHLPDPLSTMLLPGAFVTLKFLSHFTLFGTRPIPRPGSARARMRTAMASSAASTFSWQGARLPTDDAALRSTFSFRSLVWHRSFSAHRSRIRDAAGTPPGVEGLATRTLMPVVLGWTWGPWDTWTSLGPQSLAIIWRIT